MENSVNKEAFKGNINANVKDKNGFYDFNKVLESRCCVCNLAGF